MLVLLPPSEGKAAPAAGAPLALDALSLPGLTEARERVLATLVELSAGDPDTAAAVLGLSPGLRGELARNAALRTAPALPAGQLYTGVLYDALGLADLTADARARAEASLLVFSGLWGAVRISDRIPAYRCSGGVKLPGLGALGGYWRGPLGRALPEAASGLVLDLRSSAYAALWKPVGEVAGRTVTVRVLHERLVGGVVKRSVVSHFNKATKGRLLRDLLEAGAEPQSPAELVEALRELKYTVEAAAPAAGKPWALDVVVAEL
ncbi:peroxide stress protein YaaA [Streptacidiphilus sp. P02-A3a]|uniref:peroxide stress protein YaaA n=1 Tax=Streptacidiphilus sp. P02-A3a TaxID=2704468 RepID=UPI0015FD5A19|nr:peroxide stress protein YaaA [Streptacidiphilus sp. P02-A3a]QMU68344.1 peroxide stress protein YaaA [Streptacidiphilus sp. P02-A3a]